MVRVVVAYLVASFVLLQVADLVVEPLGLPEWTMTLVIVLLALGLVLTAVLAWAFDMTPAGVKRTAASGDASRPPGVSPRPGRPTAFAIVAGLSIGLGAAAWLAFRPAAETPLDDGAVVVMPARVTVPDASLAYIGEGILDLVGPKLSGDVGPRAVDARTTLHAVAETGAGTALPATAARDVARRLGAGRLLLTDVVGRAEALTITATLLSTADGRELTRTQVQGPESSLDSLAAVLVARVLAAEVGESDHRVPALTSSLPAIQSYLRGRALYRAGRHGQAVVEFHQALELDSTFALAALGFIEAASWTPVLNAFDSEAYRLAWTHRERLSRRDRDYLEVLLGPDYPQTHYGNTGYRTAVQELEAVRAALRTAPDRPELHYRLGDVFLHHGMAMGRTDALEVGEAALSRAFELDPLSQSVNHLVSLKARQGDTAGVRRLVDDYMARLHPEDRDGEAALELRWLLHQALGDPPPENPDSLGTRRDDLPIISNLVYDVFVSGQDPRFADRAARRFHEGPGAAEGGIFLPVWTLAQSMGRPTEAARLRDEFAAGRHRLRNRYAIQEALYGDLDPAEGAAARDALEGFLDEDGVTGSAELWDACLVALWDTLEERPGAGERLRRWWNASPESAQQAGTEQCLTIQHALAAALAGDPAAPRLLARADTAASQAVRTHGIVFNVLNLTLSRAHEATGDYDAALAAARRAEKPFDWPWLIAEKLRTEGRLAALAGDRQGAIEAYRRYLSLRPNPEPEVRERDDRIRAELARLTGEGR